MIKHDLQGLLWARHHGMELAGNVEDALHFGFSLQGGVATGVDEEMRPVFYQAVFKKEE